MKMFMRFYLLGCVALFLAACQTVPYNPATSSDLTPPKIDLRVDASTVTVVVSSAPPSRQEVTSVVGHYEVPARTAGRVGDITGQEVPTNSLIEVAAITADPESGIQQATLFVNRSVTFRASNGALTTFPFPSKEIGRIDRPATTGQVPETGLLAIKTSIGEERRFQNPGQPLVVGTGVVLTYFAECKNFNGQKTQSNSITIVSGLLQE
jgi:hypothetical protein